MAPLSKSLFERPPADQKSRGLGVRDWLLFELAQYLERQICFRIVRIMVFLVLKFSFLLPFFQTHVLEPLRRRYILTHPHKYR